MTELIGLLRRGLALRRLGREDMMEFLRVPTMAVADWVSEWFEDELLRAGLAGPALEGLFAGPRSPGTAMNLLLSASLAGPGVRGGGAAFAEALLAAARAHGAEIRTGAEVKRVLMDDGGATGIETAAGEAIAAGSVLAACDPKRLFGELLPPGTVSWESEHRIRSVRARGVVARLDFALDHLIAFAARPGERVVHARTGETLEELERAFDPIKYGELPPRPSLDIHVPTVEDPGCAPDGGEVVSVLASCIPYHLAGGWNDERRQELADRVSGILEEAAPGFTASIVAGQVLVPPDLEERYGMTEGHPHHGEHALDQLVLRPSPECARYRTPVRGLFLGGSGSHPGGGLSGVPGLLSASALLREIG